MCSKNKIRCYFYLHLSASWNHSFLLSFHQHSRFSCHSFPFLNSLNYSVSMSSAKTGAWGSGANSKTFHPGRPTSELLWRMTQLCSWLRLTYHLATHQQAVLSVIIGLAVCLQIGGKNANFRPTVKAAGSNQDMFSLLHTHTQSEFWKRQEASSWAPTGWDHRCGKNMSVLRETCFSQTLLHNQWMSMCLTLDL